MLGSEPWRRGVSELSLQLPVNEPQRKVANMGLAFGKSHSDQRCARLKIGIREALVQTEHLKEQLILIQKELVTCTPLSHG